MKILFYNHTGKVSGAERMLLMILAGLDRNRFESILLCPEENALATLAQRSGVATASCPSLEARFTLRIDLLVKYLLSFFQVIKKVRATVVETKPDLVHANSIRAGLVATAATFGLRKRVVWHLHDLLPRHPLSSAIRLFAFLFARARMIAVSQAVADNFAGHFFSLRNRVSVILNGIELERFKPISGLREITRRQLQLDDSDFVVGIVGLLTPRKGQLQLIQSFAKVVKKLPNAKLLIVGSPVFNRDHEYAELLKSTVDELRLSQHVRFLGARDDVPALMQSFDLLVMNSSVEPFGLVIIEAMASGAPILAAVSGGVTEILENARTGWLVTHGDVPMLANRITSISRLPETRREVSERARRHVQTFSAERYLTDLAKFYELNQDKKVHVSDRASLAVSQNVELDRVSV